ncbi:MAG: hypothetical protein C0394_08090 [Syntrophus sp. (in: bacteria)]|nr:hypothetical protein [Syntrophus sp. (in: bacteria)]
MLGRRNVLLIFGLSVSLIGLCVVFFVLVLLMGVIKAISVFTTFTEKVTVLEEKGGAVMHARTLPVQTENDAETVAVIAAALAAYLRKP